MNSAIENLTVEGMKAILERALSEGKISEVDLNEEVIRIKRVQELADFFHLALCEQPHATTEDLSRTDISESKCSYYIEQSMNTCWEMPAHLRWLTVATGFMEIVGYNYDADIDRVVSAYTMSRDEKLSKFFNFLDVVLQ